ncbi:MAG TPA: Crp/Fnr family transcriptional regulator [Candidatus Acutalibacter pullistercoris]|uniref:Crp/Fnr family transcriptional regulator n=1 Tax=Candidatus Acutalibacter pullistercoris TaxID=2838418 RepID=A0A9D1YCX4_9FIRM|nr:Crp/Fnr family transcriptional regulator [Candidatus Acutalibacter pullistercoris]
MELFSLVGCPLFAGVPEGEWESLLSQVGARERYFQRGETLLSAGERTQSMGVVLAGRVTVEHHDFWGNRSVLDSLGPGKVFAETYALLPEEPLQVSVTGAEAGKALFLSPGKLGRDPRLLRNLLLLTAEKNLRLSRRIFHTSSKTIRGRVLSYLSFEAARNGSREFTIPFTRQQLADYLEVDRSALSHELGNMAREGLLRTSRSRFTLLVKEEDRP